MSESEQESDPGSKQAGADAQSGEEQQPKQAQDDSSGLWDTKEHSDAPGPFGTGEQQTESEAAGNPLAEDDPDEE